MFHPKPAEMGAIGPTCHRQDTSVSFAYTWTTRSLGQLLILYCSKLMAPKFSRQFLAYDTAADFHVPSL